MADCVDTFSVQCLFGLAGIEDLFRSLSHIQSRLRTIEDQQDVAFLNKLFQNSRFQHALSIHNKVRHVTGTPSPRMGVTYLSFDSKEKLSGVFRKGTLTLPAGARRV